jgi:putrescine aminotransferase
VVSHEIIELLREKDDEFNHGFTYSGHPTCAAVALRNIEIIEREGSCSAPPRSPVHT